MKAVVFGASSGLGRALAEELGARGAGLTLISGDTRDLVPLAADLRVRFGCNVQIIAVDARNVVDISRALNPVCDEIVDALLLPIGAVDDDDGPELPAARAIDLLNVNFTAPAAAIQVLLPALRRAERPAIVGFGSIAAVRGRSRNSYYAAAKRALQTFFESLQHWLPPDRFSIRYYVLGYIDTNLAFGRQLPFRPAKPNVIARRIVSDLSAGGSGIAYLPRYWYGIASILRFLPWPFFRRLKA